jgi:ectoine hydroxylase-related dioxygenase (phytanoyl-CoA dioxygenase family)
MEIKTAKKIYPSGNFDLEQLINEGFSVFRLDDHDFLEDIKKAYDFAMQFLSAGINPASAFKNSQGIPRHFQFPHLSHQVFKDLILNASEIFIKNVFDSQRLYVTHNKISFKQPGEDVPWYPHQDNGYKLYNGLIPRKGVSMGIFLEDADDFNGTLQFYPKSHLAKTLPHKYVVEDPKTNLGQVVLSHEPQGEPYSVIAKRGDIAVWSLDLIHQSQSNHSDEYRCVYISEIEPFQQLKVDERGNIPIVLNTRLSLSKKIRLQALGFPIQIRYFLKSNQIIRKAYYNWKGSNDVQ